MKVLFVCTANKLRSPTAEDVFRDYPGIEAMSAGTDANAPNPLTAELVASVDLIIVMENHHREWIRRKFKKNRPADSRIITLNIPDEYERGDPELIELLKSKVTHRLDKMTGKA
ncbi:MAG: low molecular weight protein tyrosine phosphatase family protein [Pelagibaca sp.]